MSGLIASDTKACSTWLSIGSRKPAIAATRELTAGDGHADLAGTDHAARRLDAGDLPLIARETGDFAVLDDIDAKQVGWRGHSPRPQRHGARFRRGAAAVRPGSENARCRS